MTLPGSDNVSSGCILWSRKLLHNKRPKIPHICWICTAQEAQLDHTGSLSQDAWKPAKSRYWSNNDNVIGIQWEEEEKEILRERETVTDCFAAERWNIVHCQNGHILFLWIKYVWSKPKPGHHRNISYGKGQVRLETVSNNESKTAKRPSWKTKGWHLSWSSVSKLEKSSCKWDPNYIH